uniref:Uncharacterized protein n=1 Tax=Spongospora subterranea TaxID=70186 RepID=A0A0H5R6T7_9EUKA|eukprot:CRZ09835.1 hypothetical protein [Spongospora subterranea]
MGKAMSRLGRPRVRLLLLGLDAAGKTTVLAWMKKGAHQETVPTIGFNVEEILYNRTRIQIWDVGGQDRLRALWRPHYRGTSGIIFVVDSSDAARITLARQELMSLMKEEALNGVCLCILANKQDLPAAISTQDLAIALGVAQIEALGYTCTVIASIANQGEGIDTALRWLSGHAKPI